MAVTDHYDFWYLDPDEEISDFPSMWDFNIDNIDAAIHDAATAPVSLSRLPSLPASKTTSGTFADARIPATIARTTEVDDSASELTKVIDRLQSRISQLESQNVSTGFRSIALPDPLEGAVYVVRENSIVTVYISNLRGGTGSVDLGKLPKGMRPRSSLREIVQRGSYLSVGYSGTMSFKFNSDTAWHIGAISYVPTHLETTPTPPFNPA